VSYELRECSGCDGAGFVVVDAEYDPKSGQLVQTIEDCATCRGVGSVPLFVYAPLTRGRARKAQTASLVWAAWNGDAKERKIAEKELRRRDGSR
jgi:hypothetical protein